MNPTSKITTEANTLCAILVDEVRQSDTWERMVACGDAIRHVRREEKLHQAESDHLGCLGTSLSPYFGAMLVEDLKKCQPKTGNES